MTHSDWITILSIATTLFIAVIGSAFVLGNKIGTISSTLDSFKPILSDVPKIKYSFGQMSIKVDELWRDRLSQSKSPAVLNNAGQRLLETSGIGNTISKYYNDILLKVRKTNPENAFQAQEALIEIVYAYKNVKECKPVLESAAFNSGYDISSVLYVASLFLRDRIISDLGFVKE